jgi:pimeloyl-ACP methyl ester carboxylesterase
MTSLRSTLALTAACLSALLWAGVAAGGPNTIPWSNCYPQFGPFECGRLQVPLDYADPNGTTISLSVIRLPATDPAHRIGSLFLNPGGPGGSGVSWALDVGPTLYSPEVRARFDIVGFDPRGVGGSTALRCFGNPKLWSPAFTPFAFPSTTDELTTWMDADQFLASSCAQRGGRIGDHMSTADVARDLDALRQAVGDGKLNYVGWSYGTMIGQTYANMFPDRVGRMIIDGVVDPIAWTTGNGDASTVPVTARFHSADGAQATLNEFFRLCDTAGPSCAFGPNSAARFTALGNALKAQPIDVTFPDGTSGELNYSTLISTTLSAMYDTGTWASLAQFLAAAESRIASPATLGAQVAEFAAPFDFEVHRHHLRYFNNIEGFPAVMCSDSNNPSSYDAWWNAAHTADATSLFGSLWTWYSSICIDWPFSDAERYTGPWTHWTANPVLVIGNTFDPATPYQNAVLASHLLPNSRLLTLHGWGHASLFLSTCIDAAASRYLVDLTLPPPGTVCEQDEDMPFAAS